MSPWTTEKPTVPGWYWWRQEKGMMEIPKEVIWHPFYKELRSTMAEKLEDVGGEWHGPIVPKGEE